MKLCDKCGEPSKPNNPVVECRVSCWFGGPASSVTFDFHEDCGQAAWREVRPLLVAMTEAKR